MHSTFRGMNFEVSGKPKDSLLRKIVSLLSRCVVD